MIDNKISLKEILKLKPAIYVCGQCGGDLHVYPYKYGTDKKFKIRTINICSKCSFKKEA